MTMMSFITAVYDLGATGTLDRDRESTDESQYRTADFTSFSLMRYDIGRARDGSDGRAMFIYWLSVVLAKRIVM